MKSPIKLVSLVLTVMLAATFAHADTTFGEGSSGSGYWQPVSPNGTHVYANSFVAPVGGNVVSLGTWLNTLTEDLTTVLQLQILGSFGNNLAAGPDMSTVIASTSITGISGGLAYYSASVASGALVSGNSYWFAINAIGGGGNGSYQVASANGANPDGTGSFWYSNSSGAIFDGQNLQPEMAFQVTVGEGNNNGRVPDASSTLVMLTGAFLTVAALRRRLVSQR